MSAERAALRAAVDELMADWAWHLDHGEYDRVAELFTADGELEVGGSTLRGRAAIRERYTARTGVRTTRHTYSGLRVVAADADSVLVTSTWVSWAANAPAPVEGAGAYQIADFHDTLRHDTDRLRIRSRRIVPVFRDATRAPTPPHSRGGA